MVIFIEGPDRTGKSTQIKNIKKFLSKFGLFLHEAHYTADAFKGMFGKEALEKSMNYYSEMFAFLIDANNHSIDFILDRAHLGEVVYGNKYRNYDGNYVYNLEYNFLEYIGQREAYLIVFIDEPKNLIDREDGNSFSGSIEEKEIEVNLFKEAFDNSHIENKILININGLNESEVSELVNKFLVEKCYYI